TILSTIHSGKGQEWQIVRVLNVVDGCIPSDRATSTPEEIEEERRLLYVAMTRAKTELDLIVPQRFFTHQQAKLGDRHVYASRSRFVPDTILGSFDKRNWRGQTDSSIKMARKASSSVDVAASLMRMWREIKKVNPTAPPRALTMKQTKKRIPGCFRQRGQTGGGGSRIV